jgi:uncharacterized membrane protein YbhN (UPF0104 family)
MTPKRAAFVVAKLVFAGLILMWLVHKIDATKVWAKVRDAERVSLLLGILLLLLTVVIAGWRWHKLLSLFQIRIPLPVLICIAQIGQFFLVFLPGPAGDDATRMIYISRLAPGRIAEACTTVLIDRAIGLASVLVVALFCIRQQWALLATSHQTYWLAVAMVIGGGIVCVGGAIFFAAGHPAHAWFQRSLGRLPAHTFRDEVIRIWGLLCTNKTVLAQVIAAAITTQLILCVVFYLAGVAVGIHIPLLVWFSFVPVALAANAIPITIAGLGVREYLLVLFLYVLAGVDGEQALAASFAAFAMILAVCLIGGVVFIFYRPKRKSAEAADEAPAAERLTC